MAERFEIAVSPPECVEGAMMYLCLLAYPLAPDDRKRARVFDALWAYIIRDSRRIGRLKKHSNSHHSELLRRMPSQQMWGTLELANRRIWWRLVAAEQFLFYGTMHTTKRKKVRRRDPTEVNRDRFWIKNPIPPMPTGFHGGRHYVDGTGYEWRVEEYLYADVQKKPTVSSVVQSISKRIRMPERNVWSQVVKPVRPVLHMADALRSALLERIDPRGPNAPVSNRHDEGFNCLSLLRQSEWVRRAVQHSRTTAECWSAFGDWPALTAMDPKNFIELVPRP